MGQVNSEVVEIARKFDVGLTLTGPKPFVDELYTKEYVASRIRDLTGWYCDASVVSTQSNSVSEQRYAGYSVPLKLAMADVQSDDNVYLAVSDVVPISRIPKSLLALIERYVGPDIMKLPCGLPASGFLSDSGVKIRGLFKYGELGFIAYEGETDDIEGSVFVHIFSNVSEDDYEKIKDEAARLLASVETESGNGE